MISNVIMNRGKVFKFSELPEFSVALDGVVAGPHVDLSRHALSFDHHGENCLRFCTTSACVQAWSSVMLGFDPTNYTLICSHPDLDSAASVWILKNHERCAEMLVAKLINAIGLADQHCGAFPLNGMTKVIDWLSAPYVESVRNGDYTKLSDDGLLMIIESIMRRITIYVDGESTLEVSKQIVPHSEYKVIYNENNWVMVESKDQYISSILYHQGYDRIVVMNHLEDKSLSYSLFKRSDFTSGFDLFKICKALNESEPGWGGSTCAAGSPRNHDGSRSRLSPEQVIEIINKTITVQVRKRKKSVTKFPPA